MAEDHRLKDALAEYERAHEFARRVLLPVEDELRLGHIRFNPNPHSTASYRWFRSENVVDLGAVRRLKQQGRL
jgi:hypothetical protein